MKIKRPEGRPVVAWNNSPRYILADFTDSDTVEVNTTEGKLLVSYGYTEVKATRKKKE
jgi:hypothetical protein